MKANFGRCQCFCGSAFFHIYVDRARGDISRVDFVLKLALFGSHNIGAVGGQNFQHLIGQLRQGCIGKVDCVELKGHQGLVTGAQIVSRQQALLNDAGYQLLQAIDIEIGRQLGRFCVLGGDRTFTGS